MLNINALKKYVFLKIFEIAIRIGRVSEDCFKICPCCGDDNQSFEH